jgi:hypothetical protein
MQGIYNDIPETKHVSKVHSIAAVLLSTDTCNVILPVKYVLYFYIRTYYYYYYYYYHHRRPCYHLYAGYLRYT